MEFTTPVGRLVQGDAFNGSEKSRKGEPYIVKTGPNKGNPTKKWFQAVAYPKVLANGAPNEEFYTFYRNVIEVARAGYPQYFTGPIDPFTGKPGCTHPRMALKIVDGDGVDDDGKPNKDKEGFAGHWVVKFGSSFAPRCFALGRFAPEQQLQDPSSIKRGYYVSVSGTCDPNIGSEVPGVYMNGNMICLVGVGPEIVSGPDAGAAFANIPMGSLPPGCVPGSTPANAPRQSGVPMPTGPGQTMPAQPAMMGHVGQPPQQYAAPVAPGNVAAPYAAAPAGPVGAMPAAPGAPVTPNHSFVANAGAPAAPQAPQPPAPPAGPQLTPAGVAAGGTYESFRANGWSDDQMRQHGYLV